MRIVRRASWILPAVWLLGCGGVSEHRMKALEEQVLALEKAQIQTHEKAEAAAAASDQTEQLAQMLEVLQREVTKASDKIAEVASRSTASAPVAAVAPPAPTPVPVTPIAPAAAPTPESPAANRARVNEQVSLILGVGAKGLAVQGTTYTLRLAWLLQQLDAFAANEKGYPKLVANKKTEGLIVRGIKPGSLPARLGLVNNDLLVSLNDRSLASAEDLAGALTSLGAENRLVLRRKTKELTLEYRLAP